MAGEGRALRHALVAACCAVAVVGCSASVSAQCAGPVSQLTRLGSPYAAQALEKQRLAGCETALCQQIRADYPRQLLQLRYVRDDIVYSHPSCFSPAQVQQAEAGLSEENRVLNAPAIPAVSATP